MGEDGPAGVTWTTFKLLFVVFHASAEGKTKAGYYFVVICKELRWMDLKSLKT